MKVAIVGSRNFPDPERVRAVVRAILAKHPGTEIVSGGARGVDSWAEEEARAQGAPVRVFPADWDRHGKRAGFLRNKDIVAHADHVVAFWDGESKGTQHTMNLAREAGKLAMVVRP